MAQRVFISSASGSLTPYRRAAVEVCRRLGMTPVHMEEFGSDRLPPAEVCRRKLIGSDIFVMLLAHRYGSRPPGEEKSYTELEYEWAAARPDMPMVLFVVDPEHPWRPGDIDTGADGAAQERFRRRVTTHHVVSPFTTVEAFREDLILALRRHESSHPADAPAPAVLPSPPQFHANPPYVGSAPFTGRLADLDGLDEWARSADPVMLVEAIGGVGKSALTWQWATTRAPELIPGLTGRLWWSFYDKSASLTAFLHEVLAYTTRRSPGAVRELPRTELIAQVIGALRARPTLLVLDGFERLLGAYHRFDPSKLLDDAVEPRQRSMIDPQDEDALRQLAAAGPSKVLISSRLMPAALDSRFGMPIPGVRRVRLPGLTDDDTAALLQRLGIRGTGSTFASFFAPLGNHPLLVGIVAGLVRDFRADPGNFDRWLTDPAGGGELALGDLDLRQRRNHILEIALARLPAASSRLLSQLSVLSGTADWPTLTGINPFVPVSNGRRVPPVGDDAAARLDRALKDLEDRGLLWWDRGPANSYDLHPIIRSYVHDRLDDRERVAANIAIRDHFAARPYENPVRATTVEDLRQTITIFRAMVGAGLHLEAGQLWGRGLGSALLAQIGAYPTVVELLTPLARTGPLPTRADLTAAYHLQRRYAEAIENETEILRMVLADRNPYAETSLGRLAATFGSSGALRREARCQELRREVMRAAGGAPDRDETILLTQGESALDRGDREAARKLFDRAARQASYRAGQWFRGDLELSRLELDLRERQPIDEGELAKAEQRYTASHHQIRIAWLQFLLHAERGDFERALTAAERHDDRARNAGRDTAPALPAYALGRLGRLAAATAAVEETLEKLPRIHPADRPHHYLAVALHDLGRRAEAVDHALAAYRQAWCDGPPYCRHWNLRDAEELLVAWGVPLPTPPVAATAAATVPLEPQIQNYLRHLRRGS